jgi:hypothetical protein
MELTPSGSNVGKFKVAVVPKTEDKKTSEALPQVVKIEDFKDSYVSGTGLKGGKNGYVRVQTDNEGNKQSLFSFNAKDGSEVVRTDGAYNEGGSFAGNGTKFYKYVDDGDKTRGDKKVDISGEDFAKLKNEAGFDKNIRLNRGEDGHIILDQENVDKLGKSLK